MGETYFYISLRAPELAVSLEKLIERRMSPALE